MRFSGGARRCDRTAIAIPPAAACRRGITALDTLLVLWLSRLGIRVIEAFVLVLIATIAGCFAFEILLARPDAHEVAYGLIPKLNASSIYIAVSIFGATVMPHNLYLHSALVQTRRIGETTAGETHRLPVQPFRFSPCAERSAFCKRGHFDHVGGGFF